MGCDDAEILRLKWDHIDFNRGFIRIVDPKGGRDQSIPMNDSVKTVLDSIQRANDNPYVFPGKIPGTHLTGCRISLNRIKKAAGLLKDFRPLHGLRHSYASMLASSGEVDMYVLQKLMTHKSPLMTARVCPSQGWTLKRASNLAGDIISKAVAAGSQDKQESGLRLVR